MQSFLLLLGFLGILAVFIVLTVISWLTMLGEPFGFSKLLQNEKYSIVGVIIIIAVLVTFILYALNIIFLYGIKFYIKFKENKK